MSLVEMVVPYAAPEFPHPRKFAFDVGEYGMGMLSNSLSLGCDCLGEIHYLVSVHRHGLEMRPVTDLNQSQDFTMANHAGEPVTIKNAVCIVSGTAIFLQSRAHRLVCLTSTRRTTVCCGSIPISEQVERLTQCEAES